MSPGLVALNLRDSHLELLVAANLLDPYPSCCDLMRVMSDSHLIILSGVFNS